jgi:NADPH:quinone reductase-like Zn-dependent oxidoreductase
VKAHEVLVQVKAISINPVDAFVRQSEQGLQFFLKPDKDEKNLILGWDVSGTVTEAGSDVTQLKKGDNVFGLVNFPGHGKAYAEYVAVPADQLAIKPGNVSFEEASAATLAALTAWQGLVTHAAIKKGEKVVVYAAAGGVGHYALQIAKHFGANVIAVTSKANNSFVEDLGADQVFDYTTDRVSDLVKGADIVLDSVAADHILSSMESLKPGGRLISLLASIEGEVEQKVNARRLFARRIVVNSNGDDMRNLAGLMQQGKLRSHVSQTFSFDEMGKAHQQIETRKTQGKIVVKLV